MRLVLLALIAACSWGQVRIEITPVTGRASDRLKEAQRRLQRVQQLVWREIRAPEERAVVEEARNSYRGFFLPEIGSEPRIATLTEDGIDILVARWTMPGDGIGGSELTVWDTPEVTYFIFRLPRASWSSDAAIRATFEKLVHARPGTRTKVEFDVNANVARDPQTH
jgi:hypothetical protein